MKKFVIAMLILLYPLIIFSEDTLVWKKRIKQLGTVKTIAINSEENLIAHNADNIIYIRDTSGNYIIDIDYSSVDINTLEFSSNGLLFFPYSDTALEDAGIFSWNLNSQNIEDVIILPFYEPSLEVIDLSISKDLSKLGILIKFNDNNSLKYKCLIWNLNLKEFILEQSFDENVKINKIEFLGDKLIFDYDKEIVFLDINQKSLIRPFENDHLLHKSAINDFSINGDGNKIVSVDADGVCNIWDLTSNAIIESFVLFENAKKISLIEWGKEENFLIFADILNNYITKYDLSEKSIVNSFIYCDSTITDFKITNDKNILYFTDGINIYKLKLDYSKSVSSVYFENSTFRIYPNPFSNYLNINLRNDEIINLQIIDILGNVLIERTQSFNNITLDLSNLMQGIYFLKLHNHNGFYIEKIIKN